MSGWLKLHRSIVEWEWYTDSKSVHLFLHLIIRANHKPSKYRGHSIERGQVLTGRKQLSAETGISEQSVRTVLNRLKSTNEITIKSTSQFSVITICNYDKYQDREETCNQQSNPQSNQRVTNNQPATNHIQEEKELKNKNNKLSTTNSPSRRDSERPKQCSEEQWQKYLAYSERFLDRQFAAHGNIARKTEPKIISGAKTMDNLIRVKGYDKEYVHRVICWAEEDQFWSANLLSLGALTNKGKNGEIKFCNIAVKMEQEER